MFDCITSRMITNNSLRHATEHFFRGLYFGTSVTRHYSKDAQKAEKSRKLKKKKKMTKEEDPAIKCAIDFDVGTCRAQPIPGDCTEDMNAIPKDIKQPCVVIVGAGIAGLSAARRLVQCGITNFKVLEASDRPGGRIRSCWLGDTVVELGADHISGACIANRVYTIAAQEQLIKYPLDRIVDYGGPFLTSDGRTIPKSLAQKAIELFDSIVAKAADLFITKDPGGKFSLGGFMDDSILKELQEIPEVERYDMARSLYGLTNTLRVKLGEDLCKVSSAGFGSYHQLPGGNARVKLGLAGVLSPLLKDLPNCSVLYCKPVETIRWGTTSKGGGDSPRALVITEDGEEHPADYVIVTVSLGVLKVMSDCLFCPALPANKVEAINNLGFGNINRIFIQYEHPFWVDTGSEIQLAWSPEEMNERDNWTKGLSGFTGVVGSSKVLSTTVGGPEAKAVEYCTDEEVARALTNLLRKFTGDPSLPAPASIARSSWSTDHNFYGSYTYMGLDSGIGHIKDLAAPLPGGAAEDSIPPIIQFAGEHTSLRHYSTLHGARETGIREADRIIYITKKLGGPPLCSAACHPCRPCS